ncbi:hypothetical protein WJX74_004020 [Apatococcus lobatus]|uniref:Uncharacterized protein n=1 Tax=Apatococcus lobatus TaxID=904363 RepID=A0AAW1S5J1_9CHLO
MRTRIPLFIETKNTNKRQYQRETSLDLTSAEYPDQPEVNSWKPGWQSLRSIPLEERLQQEEQAQAQSRQDALDEQCRLSQAKCEHLRDPITWSRHSTEDEIPAVDCPQNPRHSVAYPSAEIHEALEQKEAGQCARAKLRLDRLANEGLRRPPAYSVQQAMHPVQQ